MAVKEFNCNKLKRTFWPFTLKDKVDENGEIVEKGKKIIVRMPQKGVFEAIKEIQSADDEDETDISAIYDILAAILNNNVNHVIISREEIGDYDIEECSEILNAYMAFVDELKTNPN